MRTQVDSLTHNNVLSTDNCLNSFESKD